MKLTVYLAIFCVISLAVLAFTEGKTRRSSSRSRTSTSRRSSSSRRSTSSSKAKAAARIALLAKRRANAKIKFNERRNPTDVDENVGESTLRVDRNGGKMMILREGQVLELKLKHIFEKITNKTERIEYNLKKTNFKVERKSNTTTGYGIRAGVMTVSGTLSNNASLNLTLFMFAESANITGEDGNQYELVKGGTKINLELDWPTEVEHLEFKLSVKCGFDGKNGRKPILDKIARGMKGKSNARGPKTYSVCPNARMTFSPSYESNGVKKEMPQNYPMPAAKVSDDNESEVVLRFNGRKIFYDPTVETGDDIGDDPLASSSGRMISASSTSILLMLATILFNVFKFSF